MPTRVVVFFRRQDKFLESVYAQTVRTRPLSASCEQFKDCCRGGLGLRAAHAALEPRLPGLHGLHLRGDGQRRRPVLPAQCARDRRHRARSTAWTCGSTPSLARDLVEYKRELNKARVIRRPAHEQFRLCRASSASSPMTAVITTISRPRRGRSCCARSRPAMRASVQGFGMTPFPPLSEPGDKGFSAYPGLSPERAKELGERHARIKRTARLSARASHCAAAAIHQAAPRDLCFAPDRPRGASVERRGAASHPSRHSRPAPGRSLLRRQPSRFRNLFADPPHFWMPIPR